MDFNQSPMILQDSPATYILTLWRNMQEHVISMVKSIPATPRWRSPPQSSWVLRGDVGWAIAWCITTPASRIFVGRAVPWGRGWIVLDVTCILPNNSSTNYRKHHPSSRQSTQHPSLNPPWCLSVSSDFGSLDPRFATVLQLDEVQGQRQRNGVEDGAVFFRGCWET